jgi:hypothetical protein
MLIKPRPVLSFHDQELDMDHELNLFEKMVEAACARVGAIYFQLPVADADAVYRERVYCYELYHQLRCCWEDFPFCLGGEIDKSGNPHFQDGPYARAKPDLLVHKPGDKTRNLACVEVKPFCRPVAEFVSDLEKLTWFCHSGHYYRGVFLVYGIDLADSARGAVLRDELKKRALERPEEIDLACIHVLHHPAAGQRARRIPL